jgi:Uma2 family endonuclease
MSVAYEYRPRYTIADYGRWEGDWELIDGLAIDMGPSPFGPHSAMSARLAAKFVNAVDANGSNEWVVLQEIDWIVDDSTVVRPDLCLIHGPIPEKHLCAPPQLIVEILSDSTAEKDRKSKFELYRQQSVLYYLIVDPVDHHTDVFRLVENQYQQQPFQPVFAFQLSDTINLVVDLG